MKIHTLGFGMLAVVASVLLLGGCASGAESDEGVRIRVGGYGDAQPIAPQMFDINRQAVDTTHVES